MISWIGISTIALNFLSFSRSSIAKMGFIAIFFEPRSPTARRKGELVKFDFRHAYWQQGPTYGPCYYCACLNKDVLNLRKSSWKRIDFDNLWWMFFCLEDRNSLKNKAEAKRGTAEYGNSIKFWQQLYPRDAAFAFKCMTGCAPDYLRCMLITRGQASGHVTTVKYPFIQNSHRSVILPVQSC